MAPKPRRTIEITDPRLGNAGPQIPVELPYTASAHRIRTYIAAIPMLGLISLSAYTLATLPSTLVLSPDPQNLFSLIAILIIAAFGISLAGILVTAIRDLNLTQPIVVMDENGILDRRLSDTPISWSEISRVLSYAKINGGVLLELKREREVSFNLFRAGTIFHIWRTPRQAAYISMNRMLGPYFPPGVIFAFAHEHSIPVFEKRRFTGITEIPAP